MGRTNRTKFRNQVLRPLLEAGWIEMTVPDKPRSRNQRYRTTAAGRGVLAAVDGEDAQEQARTPRGPEDPRGPWKLNRATSLDDRALADVLASGTAAVNNTTLPTSSGTARWCRRTAGSPGSAGKW